MTMSNSVPATIEIRRSRLLGLVAAVAAVAAGITAALFVFAVNTEGSGQRNVPAASPSTPSANEQAYVRGIASLTPVQQAAAFGGPGAVLDALGLSTQDRQYVQGITSLTPAQQAVAFGR